MKKRRRLMAPIVKKRTVNVYLNAVKSNNRMDLTWINNMFGPWNSTSDYALFYPINNSKNGGGTISFSFDFSSIPDDARIISVYLSCYISGSWTTSQNNSKYTIIKITNDYNYSYTLASNQTAMNLKNKPVDVTNVQLGTSAFNSVKNNSTYPLTLYIAGYRQSTTSNKTNAEIKPYGCTLTITYEV